ncbi:MAG: 2-hydroxyacid dehydrogenase [Caulobacterales bacterium]|jgi:lactate dehydrogenase-like 2-hydroxyacid dehydrogenase
MPEKPTILAHPGLGGLIDPFRGSYEVVTWPRTPEALEAFLAGPAKDVRAAVVIGSTGLPAEAYGALSNLEAIAAFGAGYDGIDLEACRARGIKLGNCPGANATDVADFAIGLLIAVERNLVLGDRMVRDGSWKGMPAMPVAPRGLSGLRVGIVGLGAIGIAAAKRAEAFDMEVRWTGPRPKPGAPYPFEPSLIALAGWADVLLLALRPDPGTENMIDQAVIEALGPKGVLINVGRGSVVDEDALIAALKDGRLGGAGLDVFAQEPTPPSLWADVPNTVLAPHIAGASQHSVKVMVGMVMANLHAHFAGQPMPTAVAL